MKSEGTRFEDPIIGWRCWVLQDDAMLRSVYQNSVWVPGLPMVGKVDITGIYAFKTKEQAVELLGSLHDCVAGQVQLWGDVREFSKGYRAQFARIASIEFIGSDTKADPALAQETYNLPPTPVEVVAKQPSFGKSVRVVASIVVMVAAAGALALAAVVHFSPVPAVPRATAQVLSGQVVNGALREDHTAENIDTLSRLATERKSAEQPKSAEYLDAFRQEQQRQAEGYRFEARRWGEYIELSMARDQDGPRTRSVSVLLSDLTGAEVKMGHDADENGKLSYGYTPKGADGGIMCCPRQWGVKDGDHLRAVGMGDKIDWELRPDYPRTPKERDFIDLPKPNQTTSSNGYLTFSGGYYISGETIPGPAFARPAEDDKIVFSKSGIVLYAPFGLGRMVLERIMRASENDAAKVGQ